MMSNFETPVRAQTPEVSSVCSSEYLVLKRKSDEKFTVMLVGEMDANSMNEYTLIHRTADKDRAYMIESLMRVLKHQLKGTEQSFDDNGDCVMDVAYMSSIEFLHCKFGEVIDKASSPVLLTPTFTIKTEFPTLPAKVDADTTTRSIDLETKSSSGSVSTNESLINNMSLDIKAEIHAPSDVVSCASSDASDAITASTPSCSIDADAVVEGGSGGKMHYSGKKRGRKLGSCKWVRNYPINDIISTYRTLWSNTFPDTPNDFSRAGKDSAMLTSIREKVQERFPISQQLESTRWYYFDKSVLVDNFEQGSETKFEMESENAIDESCMENIVKKGDLSMDADATVETMDTCQPEQPHEETHCQEFESFIVYDDSAATAEDNSTASIEDSAAEKPAEASTSEKQEENSSRAEENTSAVDDKSAEVTENTGADENVSPLESANSAAMRELKTFCFDVWREHFKYGDCYRTLDAHKIEMVRKTIESKYPLPNEQQSNERWQILLKSTLVRMLAVYKVNSSVFYYFNRDLKQA